MTVCRRDGRNPIYNLMGKREISAQMSKSDFFKSSLMPFATVVLSGAVAFVGNEYSAALKERELQGKFVEIAIEILRNEPEPEKAGLRRWAVEVIDSYSGVPLKNDAKETLINNRFAPPKPVTLKLE